MQLKQNPFSLYDFLGYFIPGAVLVVSVSAWSLYELGVCSLAILECTLESGHLEIVKMPTAPWAMSFVFVLASYVFGFAMSLVSSLIIEKYLILRKGYPSRYRFAPLSDNFLNRCNTPLDWICCIISAPVGIFDFVFGVLLGLEESYYKEYKTDEKEVVEAVISKIFVKLKFPKKIDLISTDFNWHKYIYHYIYEKGSMHASKIQNYVALYGFSRTTSMVFVLLFWISILAYVLDWTSYSLTAFVWHLVLFAMLAYSFFLGFAKFYRRYTDEIFMAAVALEGNDSL